MLSQKASGKNPALTRTAIEHMNRLELLDALGVPPEQHAREQRPTKTLRKDLLHRQTGKPEQGKVFRTMEEPERVAPIYRKPPVNGKESAKKPDPEFHR